MALFPTEAEAAAFGSLDSVIAWVGVPDNVWLSTQLQLGDPRNLTRNIAMLPHALVHEALRGITVPVPGAAGESGAEDEGEPGGERALTPVETAQVGMVWRICRRMAHRASGQTWESYIDIDPCEAPPPAGTVVVGKTDGSSGPLEPTVAGTKLKLSTVLDQGDDGEVAQASSAQVESWFQSYISLKQAHPPEEEEPTAAQLTALHHRVVVLRSTPYADFALWGPFGRKALRAGKFRAWLPAPGGGYLSKELPGPESLAHWVASWRVFVVAALMLGVVAEASLQAYERCIERLTRQWPTAWHLIVLADDKCRAEHLERLRRRTAAAVAEGGPRPSDWDPERPWTTVFRLASEDSHYWDEQVRHPAAPWVASGARGPLQAPEEEIASRSLPGGVQAIRPETEHVKRPPAGPADAPRPTKKQRQRERKVRKAAEAAQAATGAAAGSGGGDSAAQKGAGKSKGGKAKYHHVDQAGTQLCYSWNSASGPCSELGPNSTCPNGRSHKCQICLSPSHRVKECPSRG